MYKRQKKSIEKNRYPYASIKKDHAGPVFLGDVIKKRKGSRRGGGKGCVQNVGWGPCDELKKSAGCIAKDARGRCASKSSVTLQRIQLPSARVHRG